MRPLWRQLLGLPLSKQLHQVQIMLIDACSQGLVGRHLLVQLVSCEALSEYCGCIRRACPCSRPKSVMAHAKTIHAALITARSTSSKPR